MSCPACWQPIAAPPPSPHPTAFHCPYPCCRAYLAIPAAVPPPAPRAPGWVETIAAGALVLGGLALTYKALQALLDEDYGTIEYPKRIRDQMREDHIAVWGPVCPSCGDEVPFEDLTIDHVIALINGGMTSRANAQVLCRRCNGRKAGHQRALDYFWGRSY